MAHCVRYFSGIWILRLFIIRTELSEEENVPKKALLDEQAFLQYKGHEDYEERILRNHKHQELLFRLADRLGALNISFQTETRTLTNGDETFQAILDGLKRAKHHIHMEYYIVRDDKLGTEIKDILIQKSKRA